MSHLTHLPEIANQLDSMGLHREADILDSVIEKYAIALSYEEKPILADFAKIIILLKRTKPGARVGRTDLTFPYSKDPLSGMDRQRALDKTIKELGKFLQYLDSIYQQRYRGTEDGERYLEFIEQVQNLIQDVDEAFSSKEERRGVREILNAVAKVKRVLEKMEFHARSQEWDEGETRIGSAVEALDRVSYAIEDREPEQQLEALKDFEKALPRNLKSGAVYDIVYSLRKAFPFTAEMVESQMDVGEQHLIIERKEKVAEKKHFLHEYEKLEKLEEKARRTYSRWNDLYEKIKRTNWNLPSVGYRAIRDIPEPGQAISPASPTTPSTTPPTTTPSTGEEERGWGEWGPPVRSLITKRVVIAQEETMPDVPIKPRPMQKYIEIPERKSLWARYNLLDDMVKLYAERYSEWEGLGEEVPFWLFIKKGLPTELELRKGPERERLIKNKEVVAEELKRLDQDLRLLYQSVLGEKEEYARLYEKAEEVLEDIRGAYEAGFKEALWNLWHQEYVTKLSQMIRHYLAPETRGGASSEQVFNKILRRFQKLLNFRL